MARKGNRNDIVYLKDIIDSINMIELYIENISEFDFKNNQEKQDAVVRRIEIIGEAVKNISEEIRLKNNDIPWREIAGMRDIVIHHYFGVSIDMVWMVANNEIQKLKPRIIEILKEFQ